jgi:hypothetical protein
MRTFSLLLLLLGFVLASPAAADEKKPVPKFPVGKETTYVTGPLDEDGYIDFEAALNERLGKGVTPDKNANVLLWKAMGPKPEGGKGMPPEFFKALGIDAPPEQGDYLLSLTNYLKDHVNPGQAEWDAVYDQQSRAGQRPWAEKDYPHIAAWLKANEKPLALVVEASKLPDYFNPLASFRDGDGKPSGLLNALLPGVQKCRELASLLTVRAMLRIDQGKFDDAWQDLLACHRLGRLLTRGATLIESLVGIAIDTIASNAELAYLERAKLTAKQVRERLKDLQALPPVPPMADKIDLAERLMYLDSLQQIRRGGVSVLERGGQPNKPTPEELQALERIDWEPALRNGNASYDRLAAALRLKDRAEREKALDKVEADTKAAQKEVAGMGNIAKLLLDKNNTGKTVGKAIGDVLIGLLMPSTRKVQGAFDRAEQVQRNLHVAFALAAFRLDDGRYPAKLDELAPKYLTAVPGDVFTGQGLVYRPTEKGYLLYSLGVNGKDEEGRWYDDDPPGDDPRVRMPLTELKPKK